MNNELFISIGGQCILTAVMRNNFSFYNKSLPFDYVRTSLSCVIKNITNNFINYIPNRNRCDYMIDKIKLFIADDHAFYNHDITSDDIKNSFKRRIDRFNNILIKNNKIIIVRAITSRNISDELKLKDELYNCIKQINNNLDLKIIFIGHRNDNNFEDIYYKSIDSNTFLFTGGYKFRLEDNFKLTYKSCIDFILKNGFLYDNLKINLNTLDYRIINNDENFEDDKNFYYLDNYYDIIPKNLIDKELIISVDKFYDLYPDFDINFFKAYNDDFKLFIDNEILNYFHLYGKNNNMVYNSKTFSNYYFKNDIDYLDENIKIFYESNILVNLVKTIPNDRNNKKINVYLFTNCQGHHINAVFSKINIFVKYFNFFCIRNYCERLDNEEYAFKNTNNLCDIFVYQPITSSHLNNTETILKNLNSRIIQISMPYTYCDWLWLFGLDIKDTTKFIKNYININNLNSEHLNTDVINDILSNNKINFDIFNRMKKSLVILKEKEQLTQIKTHDFILENYKKKRLFFTKNHISPPLVIHISQQFLKLININIEIDKNLNLGYYNNNIFQPISSYIKKIFELKYENDTIGDSFYINYFYDICNNINEEEINEKYVLYENKEIYFKDII